MATIRGNNGNNELEGTSLADVIRGYGGRDEIEGRGGNDRAYGGDGNDEIDGDGGNDRLYGNTGNDEIDGGSGDDYLYGGGGRDHIDGGRGNDSLYGNGGADVFEFEPGDGYDHVRDWQDGVDRLDLEDFNLTLSQARSSARQVGDDVKFYLDGTTVVVHDAERADFSGADFIL